MNLSEVDPVLGGDPELVTLLREDRMHDPHALLGAHPARLGETDGVVVRGYHPDAVETTLLFGGELISMKPLGGGLFAASLPAVHPPVSYRLRFHFIDGATWERDDPYRFLPTLGPLDQYLLGEGTHTNLWRVLGAHVRTVDQVRGVGFAVWAPNAKRVSLVGDFNRWDGRLFPMRALGASGVWEMFVPEVEPGALYKFEIKTQEGALRLKTDPVAREMELPPATASRVTESHYQWGDEAWLKARAGRDVRREPLTIYECHIGSWARVPEDGHRWLTYREIAPRLVAHVQRLGFTHIE